MKESHGTPSSFVPRMHRCLGFAVEVNSNRIEEPILHHASNPLDGVYRGKVIGYSLLKNTIRVRFETIPSSTNSSPRPVELTVEENAEGHKEAAVKTRIGEYIEDLPYNSSDLFWSKAPESPVTSGDLDHPSFTSIIGYNVEILAPATEGKEETSKDEEEEFYCGKVVAADRVKKTITVRYDVEEGKVADHDEISLSSTSILRWMPPSEPSSISIDMCRPKPPSCAKIKGYQVEIRDEKEPEQYFLGTVISCVHESRMMTVAYQVEEDYLADHEEMSMDSSSIIRWIPPSNQPSLSSFPCVVTKRVAVPRPLVEDMVGYNLELQTEDISTSEQSSGDHCFMGKVVSVHDNMVRVQYEVEDEGDEPDFDLLPVDSPKILKWCPPRKIISIPRPTIEHMVGSYLYVGPEQDSDLLGKVVSLNAASKLISVEFEEGETEDISYLLGNLRWVKIV